MSQSLHQPRHARTEPPREDSAVVIQFPGSDPLSAPLPVSTETLAAGMIQIWMPETVEACGDWSLARAMRKLLAARDATVTKLHPALP